MLNKFCTMDLTSNKKFLKYFSPAKSCCGFSLQHGLYLFVGLKLAIGVTTAASTVTSLLDNIAYFLYGCYLCICGFTTWKAAFYLNATFAELAYLLLIMNSVFDGLLCITWFFISISEGIWIPLMMDGLDDIDYFGIPISELDPERAAIFKKHLKTVIQYAPYCILAFFLCVILLDIFFLNILWSFKLRLLLGQNVLIHPGESPSIIDSSDSKLPLYSAKEEHELKAPFKNYRGGNI